MRKNGLIIAIDGPAGAGKTTTAMLAAKKLGYICIDTGAMYRAVALKALQEKLPVDDETCIAPLAQRINIRFKWTGNRLLTFLDGIDVSDQIRSLEVTKAVTPVSQLSGVRKILVEKQRELGRDGGVVMEGRDIGTEVFPDSDLKIFLDASIDERARRRFLELESKGINIPISTLKQQIVERDNKDKTREHGPLRIAEDAAVIDTTGLSIEEQVEQVVMLAQEFLSNQ